MMSDLLRDLLEHWESDENRLRALGQTQLADFAGQYRKELRVRWLEWWLEAVSLEEAAAFSGLSYDGLRKKVSRGEIPNVGEGRPRIRRCDLPMRAPGPPDTSEDTIAGRILANRGP